MITPKTSLSQVGSRTQLRLENIYGEGLIAAQELQNSGHVAQWVEKQLRIRTIFNGKVLGKARWPPVMGARHDAW